MTQATSTSQSSDEYRRALGTQLLAEIPTETVVLRTASGEVYTAGRMYSEVFMGTDVGRGWLTEVFRVARDMIARGAKK